MRALWLDASTDMHPQSLSSLVSQISRSVSGHHLVIVLSETARRDARGSGRAGSAGAQDLGVQVALDYTLDPGVYIYIVYTYR